MIYTVIVPTGRQTERHPQGTAQQGHYVIEGDTVFLTDADGNKSNHKAPLNGLPHRVVAARLILHRWQDERSESLNGFGRGDRLAYPKCSY
jgi:hypothetical protein